LSDQFYIYIPIIHRYLSTSDVFLLTADKAIVFGMPFVIDFPETTEFTNNQFYELVWNGFKKLVMLKASDDVENHAGRNEADRFEGHSWKKVKV
jgi:hypothetical protein